MAVVKILQIGREDWTDSVTVPETVEWLYTPVENLNSFLTQLEEEQIAALNLSEEEEKPKIRLDFNGLLITDEVEEEKLLVLDRILEAYSIYKLSNVRLRTSDKQGFFRRKVVRSLDATSPKQEIVNFLGMNLFAGQYGSKYKVFDIDVNPDFQGTVDYNGHISANFEGEFGIDFQPLYTYRYNTPTFPMSLELWLEYIKSAEVEIQLRVFAFSGTNLNEVLESYIFSEEEMKNQVILPKKEKVGYYAISVWAKGQGRLEAGSMHWRYSRMGLGQFVLGGKRHSDEKRQELITYFNPGDMKPPLNVYFSGFRGAEGFEGFFMMKRLGAPFLLVGDPRLEGGSFYSGTEELEAKVKGAIQEALDYLEFDDAQLILSGLSMGTFGALYYGADFKPHAIVVGKPFTNVGDTVKRLKLKRPDEFETSADMLRLIIGQGDENAEAELNQRFWDKFSRTDFKNTKFAIAFMEQDDYDSEATERLIEHFSETDVQILIKGYEGRHNDNSRAVTKWFQTQYAKILREDFGRK